MTRVRVQFTSDQPGQDIHLEAPDVVSALTIADINVQSGKAELWEGEHRLAKLSRQGTGRATYWRVD